MNDIPDKLFFTRFEIATLFSVSTKTVYCWVDQGKLDAVRPGGRTVRIPLAALKKFVNEE